MRLIVTGDTHGTLDIDKVVKFFEGREKYYSKNDYLIICGDVGVCGFTPTGETKTRNVLSNLPVTTLFVDGNHEHFKNLNSFEVVEWNGGKVHFVERDIIHLMRGQVYCIDGVKLFSFGGAYSTDRRYRTEGEDWFAEELPNKEEYEEGWNNLKKAGFKVDYILTHSGPREVLAGMGYGELSDDEVELRQYFQRVANNAEFKSWYFGHFHDDIEMENTFFCLYDEVIEL